MSLHRSNCHHNLEYSFITQTSAGCTATTILVSASGSSPLLLASSSSTSLWILRDPKERKGIFVVSVVISSNFNLQRPLPCATSVTMPWKDHSIDHRHYQILRIKPVVVTLDSKNMVLLLRIQSLAVILWLLNIRYQWSLP